MISWSRFKDQTLIKAYHYWVLFPSFSWSVLGYHIHGCIKATSSLPPPLNLPITPSYCCLPGTLIITLKWVSKVIHICYGCNASISRSWLYILAPLIFIPSEEEPKPNLTGSQILFQASCQLDVFGLSFDWSAVLDCMCPLWLVSRRSSYYNVFSCLKNFTFNKYFMKLVKTKKILTVKEVWIPGFNKH